MNAGNIKKIFYHSGHVVYFIGIDVARCSKLQSKITLQPTEEEHTCSLAFLRDVTPLISMIKEIHSYIQIDDIKM